MMRSVKAFWGKYEAWIIMALAVLLIALISFLLGYVLGAQNNRTPIIIEKHISSGSNATSENLAD